MLPRYSWGMKSSTGACMVKIPETMPLKKIASLPQKSSTLKILSAKCGISWAPVPSVLGCGLTDLMQAFHRCDSMWLSYQVYPQMTISKLISMLFNTHNYLKVPKWMEKQSPLNLIIVFGLPKRGVIFVLMFQLPGNSSFEEVILLNQEALLPLWAWNKQHQISHKNFWSREKAFCWHSI